MDVVVSTEARFDQTPDGAVWTSGPYAHEWWGRYLEVFDRVRVMARVGRVAAPPAAARRADGDRVSFVPVPYFLGPYQYLRRLAPLKRAVAEGIGEADAVIMRVGSPIANCIEATLRRYDKRPFAVEVVGDPYDVFAPGTIRHPLRPLFRWWFSRSLARQCRRAAAVAYVTERTLQRRYPSAAAHDGVSGADIMSSSLVETNRTFATHYSSIDLPPDVCVDQPHLVDQPAKPHLIFVGSLEQPYKGLGVLLEAIAACRSRGLAVHLSVVGEGRYRPAYERQCAQLNLADAVSFRGHVPSGAAVRAALDAADMFVLPSRTEGLPRAMIEAMARGLPCIGSAVGGIPELLEAEDLVPPDDVGALAAKLAEVLTTPGRMSQMAVRNLAKAHSYCEDVLRTRRNAFLTHLRATTEQWVSRGAGGASEPLLVPARGQH